MMDDSPIMDHSQRLKTIVPVRPMVGPRMEPIVGSMERPTIKPRIRSMTKSRTRSMKESSMEPVSESSNVESTPTRVATVVSIVIVLEVVIRCIGYL